MTKPLLGFIRAPLFAQVLALMILTFMVFQVASFVSVLSLPKTAPIVYTFPEIVRAYQGQPPEPGDKPLVIANHVNSPNASAFRPADPGGNLSYRRAFGEMVYPQVSLDRIQMHSAYGRWRDYLGPRPRSATGESYWLAAPFTIWVQQPDNTWREIKSHAPFKFDPAQRAIAITYIMATLGLIVAAWMSARVVASPLVTFARAAERLGRDPNAPPLSLRGSSEVATAAAAFNDMQTRLRRYVEDRTAMIGAIAHDLRTPLTRLRFRIEGVPDDIRAKMSSDLDQMEAMISATLSFVRDATQDGARTKLELSSLLQSLADDMVDTGADVTLEQGDKIIIEGDPVGLKRLFSNLLVNAIKYGKRARVRVIAETGMAVVEVDDDGPGVPETERERVFEPFYRREPSRNRETGGIGLGLAVVRTIVRAHGGDAELKNREGGGLTARVRLPL